LEVVYFFNYSSFTLPNLSPTLFRDLAIFKSRHSFCNFKNMLYLSLLACVLSFAAPGNAILESAARFGALAASTLTSTGDTRITGDLGVYPGTAITGFPPGIVTGATHAGDSVAKQAQDDALIAYNNLAAMAPTESLTGQDLGGLTLTSGVYSFASSGQLTGTLTLDAQGNSNAAFVFQFGSTITTAVSSRVVIINGGSACNVYWQVGSSATIGTTTTFLGNIVALTSITFNNGVTTQGGAYALNGAITLDGDDIAAQGDCSGTVARREASSTSSTRTTSASSPIIATAPAYMTRTHTSSPVVRPTSTFKTLTRTSSSVIATTPSKSGGEGYNYGNGESAPPQQSNARPAMAPAPRNYGPAPKRRGERRV
jgi:hypothetical protein